MIVWMTRQGIERVATETLWWLQDSLSDGDAPWFRGILTVEAAQLIAAELEARA